MPDPIDNLFDDLGKARGRVKTDLLRLPAVDPLIYLLDQVDSILSRAETDIREAKNVAMAPLRRFEEWKSGNPEQRTKTLTCSRCGRTIEVGLRPGIATGEPEYVWDIPKGWATTVPAGWLCPECVK